MVAKTQQKSQSWPQREEKLKLRAFGGTTVDVNGDAPMTDMIGITVDGEKVHHDNSWMQTPGSIIGSLIGSYFGIPFVGGAAGRNAGQTVGDLTAGNIKGLGADVSQNLPPGMQASGWKGLLNGATGLPLSKLFSEGGIARRDYGGVLPSTSSSGLPDPSSTGMPMSQAPTTSTLQTLRGLPEEKLREMRVQQGTSQMGSLIDTALTHKQFLSGQQPSTPVAQQASGGIIPKRADGGSGMEAMSLADPAWIRSLTRNSQHGLLKSGDPYGGRTDTIPHAVAAGSYVLPADVVSGLGQGDTMSGAGFLDRMFHSLPYGMSSSGGGGHYSGPKSSPLPSPQQSSGLDAEKLGKSLGSFGKGIQSLRGLSSNYDSSPLAATSGSDSPDTINAVLDSGDESSAAANSGSWLSQAGDYLSNLFATGGVTAPPDPTDPSFQHLKEGGKSHVPVIVAPGEYLVHPHYIARLGDGDTAKGHEVLKHFVNKVRKHNIRETSKLPGPVE